VSLLLTAGFFLLAIATGMSAEAIGLHVAAGALVLAIAFVCFARGWIGGGDAKLAAAVALWLGFEHLFAFMVYAALAGGTLATTILSLRQMPLPRAMAAEAWAVRLHDRGAGIPYGIALAAAALVIYPHTAWFTGLAG
jgi:prepilin peptidase CpaA